MPWTFYNASGQKLSTAATSIDVLDIDGATDIGADIVDADLFIIDDGAGGTNRKTTAARLKTYIGAATLTAVVASGSTAVGANTATQVSTAVMSDAFHFIIWDDSRSSGTGGTMIGSFVQGDESLAATCCANYERSGNGSTTDRILLTTGEGSSVTHVWAVQEIS
jgi:hypothetical protein